MRFPRYIQTALTALMLSMVLVTTSACSSAVVEQPTALPSAYEQLERGDTSAGQAYGDWVVSTAKGLVSDAYVRDNDKLGVVITSDVEPNEVKTLAKSLLQGFRNKFADRDLTVLMYAPDKELILTAKYDDTSNQVVYQ